jgi:leucyl aminopeptidase
VTTYRTSTGSVREAEADLLLVPVTSGDNGGAGLRDTGLADVYTAATLTGKKGEDLFVSRRDDDRFAAANVLLVGVGPRDELDVTSLRRCLAKAIGGRRRFSSIATSFALALPRRDAVDAVQAVVEAIELGSYRFGRYKTVETDDAALEDVTVLVPPRSEPKAMKRAAREGQIIGEAVGWARDLVNTPAGDMPPAEIAREAQRMAKEVGLTCKIWSENQLTQGGFGGILGVGKGSANPPRMIELRYTGAGKRPPIALSGKGIAFDSGGLSLKDPAGMESMKCDMGGAASILATMRVIAQLKPRVNVIAAIPSAENMPSGTAQRPGDVITHRGGKTSEVLNTDAEGRLILADALAYLTEQRPSCIVDTATLTGACVVALGTDIAGAFGNDDELAQELVDAGSAVGEPIWQMPLWSDYTSLIESKVADVKNVGKRYGGAITAALFLSEFVDDTPWVHLDIAGPAFLEQAHDLGPSGATGVPTRALVRFVLERAGR